MPDEDLDFGQTIRGFVEGQTVFGRYVLRRVLGRGGMGVVWLAWDERLEREVALKFMPEMVRLDDGAIDDLKRETRRSLGLTHPNIVRIHDFLLDESTAAIAMEYVDGATLTQMRLLHPSRVFEVNEIREWVRQALSALAYAHGEGKVVHRDLKPSNLMVTSGGNLKITDFGIARSLSDSVSRVSVRQPGATSGSPPYMSPQQIAGEMSLVRDDIYSLGATLYELLTGKPPFFSGDIYRQVQEVVPPPMTRRRSDLGIAGDPIDPAWEEAIAACLSKDPANRPADAWQLQEMLNASPSPAEAHKTIRTVASSSILPPAPKYLILAILVFAVLVGAGLWAWFGISENAAPPEPLPVAAAEAPEAPGPSPSASKSEVSPDQQIAETTNPPVSWPTPSDAAIPAEGEVVASLEKAFVNLGEDVALKVSLGGRHVDGVVPQIPAVEGLLIQGGGKSTEVEMSMHDGKMEQIVTTSWGYSVTPKRSGEFTIPAISIIENGQRFESEPISLVVRSAGTEASKQPLSQQAN